MFKWRKRSKKVAPYEPKTPLLTSVALPEGQFSPMAIHASYSQTPPINLLLQNVAMDGRGTTPMYGTPYYHHSRSRTISTPAGHVEAPRPIRPHPSQGGFVPVVDESNWLRFDPPRAPISVPSAQFLEEQIRTNPLDPTIKKMRTWHRKPTSSHELMAKIPVHGPEYEYPEEKHLKPVTKRKGMPVGRTMSKAYRDELEEQNRQLARGPSAPPLKKGSSKDVVDFEDWKPVPVDVKPRKDTDKPREPVIEPEEKGLLKSALKKTPATKAVKSALKGGQETAYYSENEASRRKVESMKPIRVTTVPSKAWLEEQRERQEKEQREREKQEEELRRGWSSHTRSHSMQARPVYGPAAFGHSSSGNSSVTPSPADEYGVSVNRDSRAFRSELRSRRSSHQGSGSYLPPYYKDEDYQQAVQELWDFPTNPPKHGKLSWPLVEYDKRRRDGDPLIYFDAGFNPRIPRYAVKAKRGPVYGPLTREEEVMRVSTNAGIMSMTVVCQKLPRWPVYIKRSDNIRVIDVFRAIYDTYSQPLTHQELRDLGQDQIERCRSAFLQRCHDSPEFDHIEERKGMLRIDLLRGRRIFKGLVPVPTQPWTYELLFDDGR